MPDARTQAPSPARPRPSRLAVLGTAVWLLAVVFTPLARIDTLIVLSPLVIHPLILGLADTDRFAPRFSAAVAWVQLPAAVSLVGAFLLAPSELALGLSIPWLGLTAATALLGLLRIRDHGVRDTRQLCISAGLCFVAIGGAWASSAALGFQPLGFSLTIVYLTAAHFHYAGFVLPVVAGLVVLELDSPLLRWVPFAVLAGVPLVAIGITGSPLAEVVGSVVLALGGAAVAPGPDRGRSPLAEHGRDLAGRLGPRIALGDGAGVALRGHRVSRGGVAGDRRHDRLARHRERAWIWSVRNVGLDAPTSRPR